MRPRGIPFEWTAEALVAGRKTCTRRDWSAEYAAQFYAGDRVNAYRAGEKLAVIRLTRDPGVRNTSAMTEEDFEAEGFAFMQDRGLRIHDRAPREYFERWKLLKKNLYVIAFELVELTPAGLLLAERLKQAPSQVREEVGR